MNDQDFRGIKNRLPELRKQLVDSSHGRIPKSIDYLEKELAKATAKDDKAALYPLLLSECSYARNDKLAVRFLRQQVNDLPDDPFPLTSLATDLARDRSARSEALALVAKAVALAKKQDRQVKYSLTCQARVALEIGDYKIFNDALRGLIEDADNFRDEDHGLEFDFLDHVDRSKVDQTLVSKYRALA
jgi:predicted Zn-dependent protease